MVYTRRTFLSFGAVALASLWCMTGCSARVSGAGANPGDGSGMRSETVFAFDTVVTLSAFCDQAVMDAMIDRCFNFEALFSRTLASSDIGRINEAMGAPTEVDEKTADIVRRSLAYSEATDGGFDISIGAVSSLWDFKEGIVPAPEAIEEAVCHVDYRNVDIDGNVVTLLDPCAKLDLGGIAKGYIADDLAGYLVDAGCTSACINLGGTVKTVGRKPDGDPWHVGIQDPLGTRDQVIASLDVQDGALVTSGLNERQFVEDGVRYWHILDPRTGYPVVTDLASASIVCSAAVDGDGYTKPLFMMSIDDALAWVESRQGIEAVLVDSSGEVLATSGASVR